MATDRNLQNLIINKLTKAQYDAIDSPSPDELYLIPDEIDNTPTQGSDNPVKSGGVFAALSGKQNTIDAQHKLDYSLIANTPTIPPADYVAMIDMTPSVDGNGNPQYTGTIVSGTFAEIDAALLAQKTVLVVGRYSTNPVNYQYFRCGEHRPAAEIVFTSTGGGEWFRGMVSAVTWYPAANGEPERVLVEDATGILGFSPTGDGNAVTSIERNPLFPVAVINKGKTFVDTAEQTLTDAQKSQARTNIGAGTYSKPSGGIPASDIADGVIPTVPTALSQLSQDATHRVVTDTEKATWNGKQDAIQSVEFVGSMYRTDVSGGGNVTIRNTSGEFPTVTNAGTYIVSVKMSSNTSDYSVRVTFGSNTYTLTSENGIIDDKRSLTVEAGSSWSASMVNSVAGGTVLNARIFKAVSSVTEIGLAAVTNDYNDLDNKPTIPSALSDLSTDASHRTVTDAEKNTWNAKSDFSGSYNDLTNKPTIPTDVVKYTSQSLTDAQKAQARTNIGATASEVFWAEYGVTTFDDVKSAHDAGKVVMTICVYEEIPIILQLAVAAEESGFGMANFYAITSPQLMYGINIVKYGDSSSWSELSVNNFEITDYRVSSWQATPDNYHYPSEKLVKDSLDGKQPTIDASHKLDYSLLSNTPTIPAAQVPADWNATEGVSRILNKPTVPATYAGSPTAGGFANKAVAIPFGEVVEGSTATALLATVDNFPTTLTNGVCAYVRNDEVASASGFTLNINGTGAKPVYQTLSDASRVSTVFNANSTYLFIYNSTRVEGGCWDLYYGYNSNDNTIGYNLRTDKMSLPTTSACYRYRLLFTSADGTHFVPANASSSTNATAKRTTTQTKIDPFGSIRYYSYTSVVSSGARPGVDYLWEQYAVTLGYSFNRTGAALTLTPWKPVYIKCAPQTDGSAIIDAETPYVQDLPTTADGKIYIYLGVATAATTLEMTLYHPVYYHDGTSVRLWTGIGIDTTPTQDSTNLVTSGGVYTAIQNAGGGGGSETDEYLSKYLTFEVLSPGTIEWRTMSNIPSLTKKINYRINNCAWVESVAPSPIGSSSISPGSIIFVSQGDIVEISGVDAKATGGAFSSFFAGTARFKAYGNIMSLIGGVDFVGLKTITVFNAFATLFLDCVGLVDAGNLRLPATTLSSNCYSQMFQGCTSLTMPPMLLPATTLTISCYFSMFKDCTALTKVPVILATTLDLHCCDSMFYGCTSITASPSLRVVSLANYCFENMFHGCTNLNYVIALFTDTPGDNYTKNWLYGVSATGTFVKNSSAAWDVSGSSGIPSGWTIETTSR